MRKSKVGPTLAKNINRKLVYKQIKQSRATSRVDVAKQLSLNKNTVNSIVDELIAGGYVYETGLQSTGTAGRKPIVIRFHAANKWAVGVQLTSTVIHWTVTDLYATPLTSFSTPLSSADPEDVAARLAEGFEALTASYPPERCLGLCLGIPGLLDAGKGQVIQSTHLGWYDVPILSLLRQRLHIPLAVDNSVKLASLGELWHGAGQGHDNFVYCYFGNGVGCGLIANGGIVRGDRNAAGELGHIAIDPQGPPCVCGNVGCLETLVSIPSLLRQLGGSLGDGGAEAGFDRALAELGTGQPAVREAFVRAGRHIGQALSYVTNLLNPNLVICDGPLMQASALLLPVIDEELKRRCVAGATDQVALVRSGLYPWASGIGAAASVIQAWEETLDSFEPVSE